MSCPLYIREKNSVPINWDFWGAPKTVWTLWKREKSLPASVPTTIPPESSPWPMQSIDCAKRSDPTKLWETSDRKTGPHQVLWSISTFTTTYVIVHSLVSQPSNHRKGHKIAKYRAKFQCVAFLLLSSLELLVWFSCPDFIKTKFHRVLFNPPRQTLH